MFPSWRGLISRLSASAINLAAQIPAERAAEKRVGHPVLLADNAGNAYPSGGAVGENLGKRTGIFASDNAGRGPTDGGGARKERNRRRKRSFPDHCRYRDAPSGDVFEGGESI